MPSRLLTCYSQQDFISFLQQDFLSFIIGQDFSSFELREDLWQQLQEFAIFMDVPIEEQLISKKLSPQAIAQ